MRVLTHLPGVLAALGCSEPGAIALASAAAARALGGEIREIELRCDPHTLKNAVGAGLPGGGGRHGPKLAAALGALGGDPSLSLQVLASLAEHHWSAAEALVSAGRVRVSPSESAPGTIYVEVRVVSDLGQARALIEGSHSRLVEVEVEGARLELSNCLASVASPASAFPTDLEALLELARSCDGDDAEALLAGLAMNLAAARGGLDEDPSEALGPSSRAELYASAGSRERMQGSPAPVQTSGYSGNQGLVATIPVWAQAEALGADERALVEALAFSHLVGRLVRTRTGVISALCNAVQAASAGAAAACVLLRGGGPGACRRAIELTLASVAGTLCDGAKPGCALKVGLGASRALQNAHCALSGPAPSERDGVIGQNLTATLENLERLARALAPANQEILAIVLEKGT